MELFSRQLEKILSGRERNGLLRSLSKSSHSLADFSSNDYIGFSRSNDLHERIMTRLQENFEDTKNLIGSTGSRLLSGNSSFYESVEERLREFHNGEAALLFNSGYDLNLGLMASIPQPGDYLVIDELVHNSMREGMKLCRTKKNLLFKHNNVEDFENVLKQIRSSDDRSDYNIFVAIESVYSMDGHCAKLTEILELCRKFNALLIVDEAHGLGVFGRDGRGFINELGLDEHPNLLARIYTFGKALGAHGAVVICPKVMREYLINYCRPLIYSTSLSFHALVTIDEAYKYLKLEADKRQKHLRILISLFQTKCGLKTETETLGQIEKRSVRLNSYSPIQGIRIPGNERVNALAKKLQSLKFDVKPIRSPTVPKGSERIRIVLHYHNTQQQVVELLNAVNQLDSSL